MTGRSASDTIPTAPATIPMVPRTGPKNEVLRMIEDNSRIAAAVSIPAQETALVAAMSASAALTSRARSASPPAAW